MGSTPGWVSWGQKGKEASIIVAAGELGEGRALEVEREQTALII